MRDLLVAIVLVLFVSTTFVIAINRAEWARKWADFAVNPDKYAGVQCKKEDVTVFIPSEKVSVKNNGVIIDNKYYPLSSCIPVIYNLKGRR